MHLLQFQRQTFAPLLKRFRLLPRILFLLLQPGTALAQRSFIAQKRQLTAVQLSFSQRDLFDHGGSSLTAGLDIRPFIQDPDNLFLAAVNLRVQICDPRIQFKHMALGILTLPGTGIRLFAKVIPAFFGRDNLLPALCNLYLQALSAKAKLLIGSIQRPDPVHRAINSACMFLPLQPDSGQRLIRREHLAVDPCDFPVKLLIPRLRAGKLFINALKLAFRGIKPVFRVFQILFISVIVDQKQIHIDKPHFIPLCEVDLRRLALLLQRACLAGQLTEDIIDTNQVGLLALELLHGSHFAVLVLHNTGRFIEQFPALLRLAVQNLFNLSLSDQRIAFLADSGVKEQFLDILHPDCGSIDQILRLSGTVQPPCDSHFFVIDRKRMIRIIQSDRDIGIAKRPAHSGAGKNDILHGPAAQLPGGLFSQNPADRVRDIRLA